MLLELIMVSFSQIRSVRRATILCKTLDIRIGVKSRIWWWCCLQAKFFILHFIIIIWEILTRRCGCD